MTLSNREKKLLLALTVFGLLFAVVFFVFRPIYEKKDVAMSTLEQSRQELALLENNIINKQEQKKIIASLKDKVDFLQRVLPPAIYQENIIRALMDLSERHHLEVKTYNFDNVVKAPKYNPEKTSLEYIVENYDDSLLGTISKQMMQKRIEEIEENKQENEKNKQSWEQKVQSIKVNLSVEGSYNNIRAAIRELENNSNMIIITSYSFSKAQMDTNKKSRFDDDVTGNIALIYPYYYANEKLKDVCWKYETEFKRHNPFIYDKRWDALFKQEAPLDIAKYATSPISSVATEPIRSANSSITSTPTQTTTLGYDMPSPEVPKIKSDFYLMMNSPSSIQPRYMIGKTDARELELQSGRKDETMELKIVEKDGKFSFQYKSDLSAFPQTPPYYPFMPNYQDKIFVELKSSPRVDNGDMGSVRLSVDNQSTRQVYLVLKQDDVNRPRLILDSIGSNVKLVKK